MAFNKVEVHRFVFDLFLVLIIVTLPFSIHLNSICIFIWTLNWLFEGHLLEKIKAIIRNKSLLLFISFFFLHFIGIFYTSDLKNGFFNLEKKLALLIIPIVMYSQMNKGKITVKYILLFFVISCFIMVAVGYVNIFYQTPFTFLTRIDYREAFSNYCKIHPTYLSIYLLFSIFILIDILLRREFRSSFFKAFLLLFAIIFFLVTIALLASRMPIIIALILIMVGVLVYFYNKGKLLLGGVFLLLIIGLAGIGLKNIPVIKTRFQEVWQTNLEPPKDIYYNSTNIRVGILICSKRIIEQNLFFGVGTGDVQDKLNECYKSNGFSRVLCEDNYNAHNQYIQTTIGLGLVGFFLFLAYLITTIFKTLKNKNYLHLAFIVLFSFVCLTESLLDRQHGVVFYAFFNSIFAFYSIKK